MNRIETAAETTGQPTDNGRAAGSTVDPPNVAEAVDRLHEQMTELRRQLGGVILVGPGE